MEPEEIILNQMVDLLLEDVDAVEMAVEEFVFCNIN